MTPWVHEVSGRVEHGQLAAGAKARVDRQHAAFAERRGQQLTAEVAGEYADRVILGAPGQLAANFPFQARYQQRG